MGAWVENVRFRFKEKDQRSQISPLISYNVLNPVTIEGMSQRYPKNWKDIALSVKEQAHWRCQRCGRQCLRPDVKPPKEWSMSKRMAYTLQVHHLNRIPEDNRVSNLIAVCSGCHLDLHRGGLCNVSQGQLSLFGEEFHWGVES